MIGLLTRTLIQIGFSTANSGFVDGTDEGRCAAVHDRDFAAIDLDEAVVDRETAQRGEKMLNRADGDPPVISDHCAERQVLERWVKPWGDGV